MDIGPLQLSQLQSEVLFEAGVDMSYTTGFDNDERVFTIIDLFKLVPTIIIVDNIYYELKLDYFNKTWFGFYQEMDTCKRKREKCFVMSKKLIHVLMELVKFGYNKKC